MENFMNKLGRMIGTVTAGVVVGCGLALVVAVTIKIILWIL